VPAESDLTSDISGLLQRVAGGDRAAFRVLHGATAAKLAGVMLRMLRDPSEVEDAVQEVFVRVWNRAARFDPARGDGLAWMVAVARNHALDRLRARPESRGLRRAEPAPGRADPLDGLPDAAPGPEALLVARGEALRVRDCLGELPAERARMVQGAYLLGLSYQDLADRFSVPLNTVRTWLRRSLISLRNCLGR